MQYFHSNHGKIAYNSTGKGEPLLCIHGTPFSSLVWKPFIDILSYKYEVFYYDLLGYGQSDKPDSDISLGIQNEILCELLDHLNLSNLFAIAHDFGGATLLRSIVLNKRTYRKIVLIDPVALSPWGSPFVRHVRNHESVFNRIPDYIHTAMVQRYIKDAIYHPVTDHDIEFLVKPWLSADGKNAFYRQIAQMDQKYTDEIDDGIAEIEIPTLILWGEEDHWIPLDKGRELHSLIAGSELITLPECGHLVQMDQPTPALNHILKFLD